MKNRIKVSIEDFAKMTSSETCKLLNNDKSLAIVGDVVGIDRHIVKRK